MKGLLSNTQIIWFKENYPIHGSKYCANHLKLTLKQTKDFAYRNKIHITKYIWDQKDLDMLNQMYPHWGLYWISQFTGVKRHILKSKVDTLKLKMLPKSERLCLRCKINYQSKRTYGVLCKNCYNKQKRDWRRVEKITIKQKFQEMIRAAKYRSSKPCDLTPEYLLDLLISQKGCCHYSGIPMNFEKWGKGRKLYSVTLDQVIPNNGYTKNNIVLCTLIANFAKSNFTTTEFFHFCKCVVDHNKLNVEVI